MKWCAAKPARVQKLNRGSGLFWPGVILAGTLLSGCSHAAEVRYVQNPFPQPIRPAEATIIGGIPAAPIDPTPIVEHSDTRAGRDETNDRGNGELYTISVRNMPLRDFVTGLARDAGMNVDIDPGIRARISLNVVDQTLPQILDRVTREARARYDIRNNVIVIAPDQLFTRNYQVDYVNLERGTENATSPGAEAGRPEARRGGHSQHTFWEGLTRTIQSLLVQGDHAAQGGGDEHGTPQKPGIVSINREAGVLTIHATAAQHRQIKELINQVLESANRQVLIESTVVEVELNSRYQDGVNWANLPHASTDVLIGSGRPIAGPVGPGNSADMPFFPLPMPGHGAGSSNPVATMVRSLHQFGQVKVLSSPKIMALNNQAAILKVVDNKIYFTLSAQGSPATHNSVSLIGSSNRSAGMYSTEIHTVPVGLVMHVTPQIDANGMVGMIVRPTLTTVSRWVKDPNPGLVEGNTLTGVESPNLIPEIRVREMESILRVRSGQVAVMGGLMQDKTDKSASAASGSQGFSVLGNMFKHNDTQPTKTELVIFLRPVVVPGSRGRTPGTALVGGPIVLETPVVQRITPAMPAPPAAGTETAPEVGGITPAQRPQILRQPVSPLLPSPRNSGSSYLDFGRPGGGRGLYGSPGSGDLLPVVPEHQPSFSAPARLSPAATPEPPPGQHGAAPMPVASGSHAVRGNFYLELGAFTDKANANELHQKVGKSGLTVFLESAEVNGKSFQRVRSGPYPTLADAEQAQSRIASETGIQAKVASY
ncbi:MAG: SPOR domain-containing protein [Magnetococcales bacterium]|nr:SPOR domain-containing protein [Magnetococcales bacterium]MBF0322463.1 SPOR domain-containing protein [Magnetococcales bacterium]